MLMLPQIFFILLLGLTITKGEEKPIHLDQDAANYNYEYSIRGDEGITHGKEEKRNATVSSGRYYIQEGDSKQSVEYVADDDGYHPHVKFHSSSGSFDTKGGVVKIKDEEADTTNQPKEELQRKTAANYSNYIFMSSTEESNPLILEALNKQNQDVVFLDQTESRDLVPFITEQTEIENTLYLDPKNQAYLQTTDHLVRSHTSPVVPLSDNEELAPSSVTEAITRPVVKELVGKTTYPNGDASNISVTNPGILSTVVNPVKIKQAYTNSRNAPRQLKYFAENFSTVLEDTVTQRLVSAAQDTTDDTPEKLPVVYISENRPSTTRYEDKKVPKKVNTISEEISPNIFNLDLMGGYGTKISARNPFQFRFSRKLKGFVKSKDVLNINESVSRNSEVSSTEEIDNSTETLLRNQPIVVADPVSEVIEPDTPAKHAPTPPPLLHTTIAEALQNDGAPNEKIVVDIQKGITQYLGEFRYDTQNQTSDNSIEYEQQQSQNIQVVENLDKPANSEADRIVSSDITHAIDNYRNTEETKTAPSLVDVQKPAQVPQFVDKPYLLPVEVPETQLRPFQIVRNFDKPVEFLTYVDKAYPFRTDIPFESSAQLQKEHIPQFFQVSTQEPRPVQHFAQVTKLVEKPAEVTRYASNAYRFENHLQRGVDVSKSIDRPHPLHFVVPQHLPYSFGVQNYAQRLYPVDNRIPLENDGARYAAKPHSIPVPPVFYFPVEVPNQYSFPFAKYPIQHYTLPPQYPIQGTQIVAVPTTQVPVSAGVPAHAQQLNLGPVFIRHQEEPQTSAKVPCIDLRYLGINKPICTNYLGMVPPKLYTDDRSSHQRKARQNFEETVRYEYGFMPPLIPSLRIDENGNPIEEHTK